MSGIDWLLFGGTRNTGLEIAKLAINRGKRVSAMVRPESYDSALRSLGVSIIHGDAFSLNDCIHAVKLTQPQYVISTMGGKNKDGRRICAIGNIHVAKALSHAKRLERYLLVTSMGCGDQYATTSDQVKKFLGEALLAKTEAENFLQDSQLPWTIVRPGGLENTPASGRYFLTTKPDKQHKSYLSRLDVAQAIIQLLEDPYWLHRIVSVQNAALMEDK